MIEAADINSRMGADRMVDRYYEEAISVIGRLMSGAMHNIGLTEVV